MFKEIQTTQIPSLKGICVVEFKYTIFWLKLAFQSF